MPGDRADRGLHGLLEAVVIELRRIVALPLLIGELGIGCARGEGFPGSLAPGRLGTPGVDRSEGAGSLKV